MLYLVEAHASIAQGDRVDAGDGPARMLTQIVDRFHPQAIYGNPTRRQVFLIVNLDTPAAIAELMYVLTWWTKTEPSFTPIAQLEIFAEGIANAKRIVSPQS
jgi:hypothetical protein